MVKANPQTIVGRWSVGIALDVHTISSTPIGTNAFGHIQYQNTYSPIGELLHRLKYREDNSVAQEIIDVAVNFLQPYANCFNLVVPVPPSKLRTVQPVLVLAAGISVRMKLPFNDCLSTTRPPTQLKGQTDKSQREALLNGLYSVDPSITKGGRILLFDDLYRSGATLNAATDVLMGQGCAASVQVLTITRTRRNQ